MLPNGMKVTLVQYGAVPKGDAGVVRSGTLNEKENQRWHLGYSRHDAEGRYRKTERRADREETAQMGEHHLTGASN